MAPGQIEISVEPFDFRDDSGAEFAQIFGRRADEHLPL
jgi:hypothetical protein